MEAPDPLTVLLDCHRGPTRALPPPRLALRAYRPPRAARLTLREGAPAFVVAPGVRGAVTDGAGPWRASGDWWDAAWSREEWDPVPRASSCSIGTRIRASASVCHRTSGTGYLRMNARTVAAALLALLALNGCQFLLGSREKAPPPPPEPSPSPAPKPSPTPPPTLKVRKAAEEVIVAAWAEPKVLPGGGGETQILVRAQKRGGAPYPGVEVRLQTSEGTLYSRNRILVTDASGNTRDRLSTHQTATITLNAGGTMYRFHVPVGPPEQE